MFKLNITWSRFFYLTEENIKKNARESAGVYMLWIQLKNDDWMCFYVGRAKNIMERLLDHLSDSEPNEEIKERVGKYVCGFEYAVISKEENREGVEKFLYDNFKPLCNANDPGGTAIEVNLP